MVESATGGCKEVDSGSSQPSGDHTPSHPVTLEPEKADRAEHPLSSEYSTPKGQTRGHTVAMPLSVVYMHHCLLSSVYFFFTSVLSSCSDLKIMLSDSLKKPVYRKNRESHFTPM